MGIRWKTFFQSLIALVSIDNLFFAPNGGRSCYELWKIILSDSDTDAFESNLMRRISGLIYLPDKINGEIKLQVIQENK